MPSANDRTTRDALHPRRARDEDLNVQRDLAEEAPDRARGAPKENVE